MKIHELKTDHGTFEDVWTGRKTFEIRKDDRNFSGGDIVHLRETRFPGHEIAEGKRLEYTGREVLAKVTHKIKSIYGLKRGWCVLAIQKLEQSGSF